MRDHNADHSDARKQITFEEDQKPKSKNFQLISLAKGQRSEDSFGADEDMQSSIEDFNEAHIQGVSPVKTAKSKTYIDLKQNSKKLTEK